MSSFEEGGMRRDEARNELNEAEGESEKVEVRV